MKSFLSYINENLSKKQQEQLLALVDDTNFEEIMRLIKKHLNKNAISTEDFKLFFERHGLEKLQWGRNGSAAKAFTQLFDENDNLEILAQIVKNNGVVSINDLKQVGNIYDYCNINVNNKIEQFKAEAQEICTWVNSRSANSGPAEILLKFILKEGGTGESGDVLIRKNNENFNVGLELEVKAATVTDVTSSGGHAVGQGDVRKSWSIYWYLDKYLFNLPTTPEMADNLAYFQNKNKSKFSNNKFIEMLEEYNISDEQLVTNIVEAIAFQYRFINSDKKPDLFNEIPNKNILIENGIELIKDNKTYEGFKNLVGVIQLYFYSVIEDFAYFMCILVAKEDSVKHSSSEGNYILFKTNGKNNELLDFRNVLKYLYFGALDSTKTTQGRTGKIYLNI